MLASKCHPQAELASLQAPEGTSRRTKVKSLRRTVNWKVANSNHRASLVVTAATVEQPPAKRRRTTTAFLTRKAAQHRVVALATYGKGWGQAAGDGGEALRSALEPVWTATCGLKNARIEIVFHSRPWLF